MIRRLGIAFALVCALASTAWAGPPGGRTYVSGNHDERFRLALYLDPFVPADGGFRLVAPTECQFNATVSVTGASGSVGNFVDSIDMVPGTAAEIEFAFSDFVASGAGLVIVTLYDVLQNGPCSLLTLGQLTETATGKTQRIISNFMNRRNDMIVSHEPDMFNFPAVGNRLLVAGNHDELLVISLFLENHVPVDGGVKVLAPNDCQYSATITASDPSGTNVPLSHNVDLSAGQVTHVAFAFSESLAAPDLIITVSDVMAQGTCTVISSVRQTGLDGGSRATYADRARFTEVVLTVTPFKKETDDPEAE